MTSMLDQTQAQRSRYVFWFFSMDWQKVHFALVQVSEVMALQTKAVHSPLSQDYKVIIPDCKQFQESVFNGLLDP